VGRGVSIISDILRFSPDAQLQTRIQSCCSVRLKSLPYPFSVNCTFLLVSCRCSQLALTQLQFLLLLRSNSPLSGFWTFVAKLFCFFPHRLLWLTFFFIVDSSSCGFTPQPVLVNYSRLSPVTVA